MVRTNKILLLLTICIFSVCSSKAKSIEKNDLKNLGIEAFRQKQMMRDDLSNSLTLKNIYYLGENQEHPVMAVLNFDKGFLVLAADDAVHPVLAYSFEGELIKENMAPAVLFWLNLYEQEILDLKRLEIQPSKAIQQEWDALISHTLEQTSIVVSPLLSSTWDQTKYYNSYSPLDPDSPNGYDGRTPNGCVAVAMASIMYYYRYPVRGFGSHTNHTYYGDFTVDFSQQTYNYEAMCDHLDFYNNEVAKLIFHCATAVDMSYSASGSGAYSENVPGAMVQHFGYDEACNFQWKWDYQDSYWKQMLQNELNDGRPIYYSGYTDEGGHAFVCDGYNSDDFFHFNFGWSGSGNGYFALNASEGSNPVGGYEFYQGAMFDCYPKHPYPYFCDSKVVNCTSGTLEDGSSTLDYLNNTHCEYVITADQAINVKVTFNYFDVQEFFDSLTFWNGNPNNGNKLKSLSGTLSQGTTYIFQTDSLYITFDTDDSITAAGWRFEFEVDQESIHCGTNVYHTPSGEISDGSGEAPYGMDMNCLWKIRVSDATQITLTFVDFNTSPEDELKVYNSKIFPNELLGSFSGNDVPASVTYHSNYISIFFSSDNYLSGDGFTFRWSTDSTSFIDEKEMNALSIYPNPANTILNVFSSQIDVDVIQVFNVFGQKVRADVIKDESSIKINVSDLPNGIYFVTVSCGNNIFKKKFVISR